MRGTETSWVTPHGGGTYTYTPAHELQECYAAFDEREYFAQAVNCYLGSNGGRDPYTKQDRHNGEAWVRANENARLVQLLDELFAAGREGYAKSRLPETNTPEPPTLATTIKDVVAANVTRVQAGRLMAIEWD